MTMIAGNSGTSRIFQGRRKDFIVMRGDSFEYTGTYEYLDDDGVIQLYDFTGCVGMMDVKKKKKDKEKVLTVGVSFSETEYTLIASAMDMEIDAGVYYYDLQIYDADSKIVTKLYGQISVLQDVTAFGGIIKEYFNLSPNEDLSYYLAENIRFNVGFSSIVMNFDYPSIKTPITFSSILSNAIFPKFATAMTFSSVLSNVLFPKVATAIVFSSVLFHEHLYSLLRENSSITFSSTLDHIYIITKDYSFTFSSVLDQVILTS